MIMTGNRVIMMKRTQTLRLLFITGLCSFALGSSDFHFINILKTYNEAKNYCRERYTDLATIHNSTEMNNLIALVSATSATRAWIGLETGDVRMWHWSRPDQKVDFLNWKAGEPQNKDRDMCAAMDQRGEWFESLCGIKRSFVCHGNSGTSGPIFVAETKSWRDAQSHCRGLSSDLISIRSADENKAIHDVSVSPNVWIGLFKDPWKWSDGSNSSFRDWKPLQPNYLIGQNCAAAIFKDKGRWNDLNCVGKRFFVCREEEPTTASEVTTLNTTDVVSISSNNATTETVTATQIPSTATVQNTLNGTSAQNTTQSSTLMSTESSQSLHPGNMILIQENMTWIEAMSYCREHHIDLVHITTKDIQEQVAEKIRNATSPHVWLGLRYTCKNNFWFWTSSTNGCYQNWATGHGSERKYDCGVTGAIEATGRQQWVGLPETEKLNFICYACGG